MNADSEAHAQFSYCMRWNAGKSLGTRLQNQGRPGNACAYIGDLAHLVWILDNSGSARKSLGNNLAWKGLAGMLWLLIGTSFNISMFSCIFTFQY